MTKGIDFTVSSLESLEAPAFFNWAGWGIGLAWSILTTIFGMLGVAFA